jgi:hypothetical protein
VVFESKTHQQEEVMQTEKSETHVYLWRDIHFAAQVGRYKNRVNFVVFKIEEYVSGIPFYLSDNSVSCEFTDDPDRAIPYFAGHMTFDGCVNGEFNEEGLLLHWCSIEQVQQFNRMLTRLYKAANKLRRTMCD